MSKIQELAEQISNLSQEIAAEANKLSNDLSNADKEINDIYHYIEFNDLSASAGYKAYKDLQNCLRKRRTIKEDIDIATILSSTKAITKSLNSNENSEKTKMYTPRIRADLFPTLESKVTVKGQIIAKGKTASNKGEYILNSLDEAVELVLSRKGAGFNCKSERIKAKILKAAKLNQSYDGWNWKLS